MHFYPVRRMNISKRNKITLLILFYLIFTGTLIVYFSFHHSSVTLAHGVYIDKPKQIAHFELIDNHGLLFTETRLKNTWSLLFFGFSSCKMICPLTLQMLNQTYERLPEAKRPQIIFISVDPGHDSIEVLNQFVHQFNPRFIALRGTMPAINTLQKQLHVPLSINPMSHGTEILLINPNSNIQAYFYYPLSAQDLLFDLKKIIK